MKFSAVLALTVLAVEPTNALLGLGRLFRKGSMPAVVVAPKHLPPTTLDNQGLDYIFDKNQVWKQKKLDEDKEFFNKLGTTHTPDYMWIGCSDARVPPNIVMGEEAGNVFVHRNVANMVINTDANLMSALQYGVLYLKVKHIIVCGHYECGGVRASETRNDHVAPLETWLRSIRDVYRLHKDELNAIKDADARHRRLVDLNVIEQCVNVFKTGCVQERRLETFKAGEPYAMPRVHAMVFDPKTGDLNRISVDFQSYIDDLAGIYELYTEE